MKTREIFEAVSGLGLSLSRPYDRAQERLDAIFALLPWFPECVSVPPCTVIIRVSEEHVYSKIVNAQQLVLVHEKESPKDEYPTTHRDGKGSIFIQFIPSLKQQELVVVLKSEKAGVFAGWLQETLRLSRFYTQYRSRCDFPIKEVSIITEFILETGELGYAFVLAVAV